MNNLKVYFALYEMIVYLKDLITLKNTPELFHYYKEQMIQLYNQLSTCDDVSDEYFLEFINRTNPLIYIENSVILGSLTLIFERKMIHNSGIVCHIEDFVVEESRRGEGIGRKLMDYAIEESNNKDCYKVILNCNDKMISFYEKFGFSNNNNQMSLYFI